MPEASKKIRHSKAHHLFTHRLLADRPTQSRVEEVVPLKPSTMAKVGRCKWLGIHYEGMIRTSASRPLLTVSKMESAKLRYPSLCLYLACVSKQDWHPDNNL